MAADLQIYAPQKLWRTQVVNRLGVGNLAATATEGFFYLPSGSGPPTGTPDQTPDGFAPSYWDHTDKKLYVYDSGWILTNPDAPPPPAQNFLQTVSFETGAVATGTTSIPLDDTIPQNTEGDQYMSLSITPKSSTSKLLIDVVFVGSNSAPSDIILALFQDSGANALAAMSSFVDTATARRMLGFRHVMTSGTTAATTFKLRAGPQANVGGTLTFNGFSGNRLFGGAMASSIVISEMAP
jgi:hypothetical protein